MMTLSNYTFTPMLSDYFFYLIVIILFAGIFFTVRKPHLRAPWGRVFTRPIAMVSAVLIFSYMIFGLFDSVHFKYAGHSPAKVSSVQTACPSGYGVYTPAAMQYRAHSILDMLFYKVNSVSESRYSAPLALTEYDPNNIKKDSVKSNGKYYRRLCYSGANDLSSSRLGDISLRLLKGALFAVVLVFLALLIVYLCRFIILMMKKVSYSDAAKQLSRCWADLFLGRKKYAWRSAFFTFLVVIVFISILYQLSLNYHVLGTDKIGQDILYVALKSIRTGLIIGFVSILFMLPFALCFGLFAGYYGGWVDDLIQYIYTTVSSIPGVLLISACLLILRSYINTPSQAVSILGFSLSDSASRDDIQFLGLCAILGLTGWAGLCRLLRAESIKLRMQPFVTASKALGQRSFFVIFKHILPNVLHIILITVVLDFSGLVLAEAVLTYVGVGVPSSIHSWGNMINSARFELSRAHVVWWPLASAMFFMFLFVLSINLFADSVRDAFDPRVD